MEITIPLNKMSIEEKIQVMESIWDDLCKNEKDFPSPAWHEEILKSREDKIKNGEDKFLDWTKARKNIQDSIS